MILELEELVAGLRARTTSAPWSSLSGKPRTFIAGADVELIAAVTDPLEAEEASRPVHAIFAAWEALPFPTVGAVRGPASAAAPSGRSPRPRSW